MRATLVVPYIVSACCGACAGILLMAFNGGAYFTLGDPYLFATAAAVAVGGASILGGTGHYLGTIAGALTLTLMVSLLTLLDVGQAWLNISYGLILLFALLVATPRCRAGLAERTGWMDRATTLMTRPWPSVAARGA